MNWYENWMVVTDLDGTLLDHHNYSWAPASTAIDCLKKHDVPLVLASSKTQAEMCALAEELEISWPLIVENGAAVAWPIDDGYRVESMGLARAEVVKHIHALREKHGWDFIGFADWSAEDLASNCGLPLKKARLALQRYGTEPILWNDSEANYQAFIAELSENQIRAVRGGRYIHLMGIFDKADGMRKVAAYFSEQRQNTMRIVALGDSPNDAAMLSAADVAVQICSAHSTPMELNAECLLKPEAPGPEGWSTAIWQWWHAHGELDKKDF